MVSPARKRLWKDFHRLQADPTCGICACPTKNFLLWKAVIFGAPDTPFEDGTFKLDMQFAEDYPNRAPKVKFTTPMFHPNIYVNGNICLDILDNRWSSTYDVSGILTSILSLLNDPNPTSPANIVAAKLYQEDTKAYWRRVQQCVEKSLLI